MIGPPDCGQLWNCRENATIDGQAVFVMLSSTVNWRLSLIHDIARQQDERFTAQVRKTVRA
jgi:hypothetical protein